MGIDYYVGPNMGLVCKCTPSTQKCQKKKKDTERCKVTVSVNLPQESKLATARTTTYRRRMEKWNTLLE